MTWKKTRPILIFIFTVCIILSVSAGVIAFGRGYRLDIRQNKLKPTGLISATSDPIGGQVLVDTKLRTATNNSFAIDPGWYTVRIIKEGFIPWEKKLRIQGEVVTRADAFLFPTNPSLSPLTRTGIENPTLSPDGTKIAFTIPVTLSQDGNQAKAGLWVYELAERPLGRNRDPQFVAENTVGFPFSGSTLLWSPDGAQILAATETRARRYTVAKENAFEDVTANVQSILTQWQEEIHAKDMQKIAAFKQGFTDVATTSGRIISFSPDETKLLYEATATAMIPALIDPPLIGANPTGEERTIKPGNLYVYDSREDKNYFLLDKKELPNIPPEAPNTKSQAPKNTPLAIIENFKLKMENSGLGSAGLAWFPTSRHLLLTLADKIDVLEYDRTNWITVYSGPFEGSFVAPWSNGSRIVILTNLNPGASTLPNLYTVNLR